ncbi:MAG: PD-(D/E)XK nuclease-like domain-containing protein [bacterium]|nr:PD-(D/E)XK nuclease-like domain-containing protein [bacterium]
MSSHQLGDFRRCPQLYHRKKLGLIADEDRPAYVIGRALHTLALEGRTQFNAEYAVGGPINPKTGSPYGSKTKAFTEWAAKCGKEVLVGSQYALVNSMAISVVSHPRAAELLSDGVAEGVIRTEYSGVPSQGRFDWFTGQEIVDLKTADTIDYFESDARRYQYLHQLAFYRYLMYRATGERFPCYFIAVEKREPFRTGVWRVLAEAIDSAERENTAAVERLKRCEAAHDWPTHYEEERIFDAI